MPRLKNAVYICGGDDRPGPRAECPEPIHDYPLPAGYVDASEVAAQRIYRQWKNVRCKKCGIYGFIPPVNVDASAQRIPFEKRGYQP